MNNSIVIYQIGDGQTQIDVRLENDTVWLTQAQMAELFQSSRTNILEHIQHIYEDEELERSSTCRKFRQVRQEGKRMVTREIHNGILYRPDGTKRLADNTLVALTLMIAESKTEEKDVMVKVVVNLINQKNE